MSDRAWGPPERQGLPRRDFLRWIGVGAGTAVIGMSLPFKLLAAADPDQNPLAGSPTRDWEKI